MSLITKGSQVQLTRPTGGVPDRYVGEVGTVLSVTAYPNEPEVHVRFQTGRRFDIPAGRVEPDSSPTRPLTA